jgi:hypothetical protein
MITRRVAVLGSPLVAGTLSACSYCYEESELIGVYRAQETMVGQTLNLRPHGVYVHSWDAHNQRVETTGIWRAHCVVELDNFALPNLAERVSTAYFHGGPPSLWSRRPTLSSAYPGIRFVPVSRE